MVRRARFGTAVSFAAVLCLVGGCGGAPKPPKSCSWSATPAEVTREDVAGTYTGTNVDGAAVTLALGPDGRYTATNLKLVDWYSGSWIPVDGSGDWQLHLSRSWRDRVSGDPAHGWVRLGEGSMLELAVGGTRAAPVLYDEIDHAETCEALRGPLRR
jgi:hypothetical protein